MEPHDYDLIKLEKADNKREMEEARLFALLAPNISSIQEIGQSFSLTSSMSHDDVLEYIRCSVTNLL